MEQTAWLIERRDLAQTAYLTNLDTSWHWTFDANEAIKFADKQSAFRITRFIRMDFPFHVCDHSWPDGF